MNHAILKAIMSNLVPLLEEDFVKHEPEMQQALLGEAKALSLKVDEWLKNKLAKKGQ